MYSKIVTVQWLFWHMQNTHLIYFRQCKLIMLKWQLVMYLYLAFWLLWNYDKEIIKDALGVSSFILVHIRCHFKPCALGRVKCHVQMLCNSVREGPDEYFVNIGDAFGENKQCGETSNLLLCLRNLLVIQDQKY